MDQNTAPDGVFVTFPAISITKDEKTNATTIDRFDINVVGENVCAVNGLSAPYPDAVDAITVVHFHPKCGLRPILTSLHAATLAESVKNLRLSDVQLVTFRAIAVLNPADEVKNVVQYSVNVDAEMVVAVNSLDGTTQQVTDEVKTIIYFQPASGMQPILSPQSAEDVKKIVATALDW